MQCKTILTNLYELETKSELDFKKLGLIVRLAMAVLRFSMRRAESQVTGAACGGGRHLAEGKATQRLASCWI